MTRTPASVRWFRLTFLLRDFVKTSVRERSRIKLEVFYRVSIGCSYVPNLNMNNQVAIDVGGGDAGGRSALKYHYQVRFVQPVPRGLCVPLLNLRKKEKKMLKLFYCPIGPGFSLYDPLSQHATSPTEYCWCVATPKGTRFYILTSFHHFHIFSLCPPSVVQLFLKNTVWCKGRCISSENPGGLFFTCGLMIVVVG